MRFEDRIAVITGGSSGIGASAAELFLSEGASVVLCGRSSNTEKIAEKLEDRHGRGRVMPFVGDLGRENTVKRLAERAISKFGKIDILVNGAGVSKSGKVEEISLADWDDVMRNNLTTCFLCCKYLLPLMKKRRSGKIVNISSIAGRSRSIMAGAHYTSAKAAIIAFTKQLAFEAAPYGINVNVICPSQTRTPMLAKFLTPRVRQKLERAIPLGYIASPEQQARVILFLASEDSNYMTGAVLDVNGGQL